MTTPALVRGESPGSASTSAAVTAGFLGWTLDAFDYFLVVYCLTAIAREFHRSDADIALSLTFTLAMRPVGALLFGSLADRYGRRAPFICNLLFISVVEVAVAFVPSYSGFLALRALFGIGMGGIWGVGGSLALEKVSARVRGLISGFLQEGYAAGSLLAAVAYFFLFERLGWRALFFLGGAPALVAVFVKFRVTESEVWRRTRKSDWTGLRRVIFANWKLFLYLTALMAFMNFCSHGTQDMYPTFLQRFWGFSAPKRSAISAVAGVGAILGGIVGGSYSDIAGRRRAIVTALLSAIVIIPLWALAPNQPLLIAGAFLMQFMVQAAWGVVPAHLAELSPDSVRGFLPGFAYQCGVLCSSTLAAVQALLAEHISYATTMAMTAAVVFAGAGVVTLLGRERHGKAFGS